MVSMTDADVSAGWDMPAWQSVYNVGFRVLAVGEGSS
jgi:hypothetical protein